jgi:tetratricopeptide (TPR) repeat protein
VPISPPALDPAADFEVALAHHRDGRLDEAEARYRRLLDAIPDYHRASHLLGVIETQRGRPESGIALMRKAFPALARAPELHVDLGNALRAAGQREEAAESYRQAIALKSDYALAHVSLGTLLNELGRYEAAASHCRTAIALHPGAVPPRIVLAMALKGAGRLPEAAQVWRKIIELEPERALSYYQLAGQLISLSLLSEAVYCADRAIALEPCNADFHCMRGSALMRLYDGERAEASFRRATELAPSSKEGWSGLSWSLRILGRFDEADLCVRRLRELNPTDYRALRHVPSTGQHPAEDADIEHLAGLVDRPDCAPQDRIAAGFALGRVLDDSGRFDEAFSRFAAANALVRSNWPPGEERFDAKAFAHSVDALIRTNTPRLFAEAAAHGSISQLPVFIVGMPRSGTTLVEQICASHSRVFGAGERDAISRIAFDLARERRDSAKLAEASRRMADAHIVALHRLGRGAVRVVDKLPDNVVLIGLIARLFPRARIIYCSRDPRDVSLSCYFQLFTEGAQYFSYDLVDCGRRCRDVQRLAAHWLKLMPLHMIEINYEKLVTDFEGESRRLINFLELEWEPACLDFHRTKRTVATVSHWQVRQPLYKSSVGRWRNYEKHLAPLFAALTDPAEASAAPEPEPAVGGR